MFLGIRIKRRGTLENEQISDEKQDWSLQSDISPARLHTVGIARLAEGYGPGVKEGTLMVQPYAENPKTPRSRNVSFAQRLLSPFVLKCRAKQGVVHSISESSLHPTTPAPERKIYTATTLMPLVLEPPLRPSSPSTTDAPLKERVQLSLQTDQIVQPSKRSVSLKPRTPITTSPISPTILLHLMKNGVVPSAGPARMQQRILARPDHTLVGMEVCAGAGSVAAKNRRKGNRRHSQSVPPVVRPKLSARPSTANSVLSTTSFSSQPGNWETDPPSPHPLDEDIEASYQPPSLAPPPMSRQGRLASPRSQPDPAKRPSRNELTAPRGRTPPGSVVSMRGTLLERQI